MASPLRILHVVPYFDGAWAYGGIPRAASVMARALARRGHHVTVCTTDACDDTSRLDASSADGRGIDLRIFPNVSNRLAYHWQFFVPVGLTRFMRRAAGSVDVAHLHGFRNLPGTQAARVLRRAGVPYVLSPNGTAPILERRFLLKRVFDAMGGVRVLTGASRVLAVSLAERAQLLAMGVPERRIVLVPNPLDEQEFAARPAPELFRREQRITEPIVLFLGKLTPRKGVDVLLRAIALAERPCRLVIAGNDMGSGSGLDRLTSDLGLTARVNRIGLLKGARRLEALSAADVVVYPSRDEVFGLVPLEALLCGTPVVVSNDSGCGEIIGRTGGGHIVPWGDPQVLAGAIDAVLASPDLWRARAAAASGRARAMFGSEVVTSSLEEVYGDVLRSRDAVEDGRDLHAAGWMQRA